MKQKNLLNYLPQLIRDAQDKAKGKTLKKSKNKLGKWKDKHEEKPIQKDLTQILEKNQEYRDLVKKLGNNWRKNENGFGYIDKNRIMLLGTIQDFNRNFFRVYDKKDFKKLKNLRYSIIIKFNEEKEFVSIKNIKYKSYYLKKALEVLGQEYQLYQHKRLKLLILRNTDYATLICPNFS
ncbi:MAG: hypothetical protein P8Y97_07910 [Candidatus Lokiarchaeota archaeon]